MVTAELQLFMAVRFSRKHLRSFNVKGKERCLGYKID